MLSDIAGRLVNCYPNNYVVLDLETTGLITESDSVIEISAIKVRDSIAVEEFSTLVNPGFHIPYSVSSVTGIMDDMVVDSPMFEEALSGFINFAGDMVLVGQNIRNFDLKFLYRDAMKFWGKTIGNDYVDTLILSKCYLPELNHYDLSSLAVHYGISAKGAHRALNDCRMTQKIYEKLKEEIAHPSPAALAVKRCPRCGNILKKRDGKYGEFYGCMSYPDCKYTEGC